MVGMHLVIVALMDFADLSLGMLMVHLFTMDGRWLAAARRRLAAGLWQNSPEPLAQRHPS
jgi:hypothetical protein